MYTSQGSRRGISTSGRIVSVRSDSGIILRCTKEGCRRVLRDGMCGEHGEVEGSEDLRLMMVIDSGVSNASLLVSREPSESVIGESFQEIAGRIRANGPEPFMSELKERLLGRRVTVNGRSINDDRGCMIQAESLVVAETNPVEIAESVIERWGVVL